MRALKGWRRSRSAEGSSFVEEAGDGGNRHVGLIAMREDFDHVANAIELPLRIAEILEPTRDGRRSEALGLNLRKRA